MKDVQRVAIVDPSDATREPLRNLLLGLETVWLEAECSRYEFFPDVVEQSKPDLALISLDADPNRGLQLIQQLSQSSPYTATLAVSSRTDGPFILQTLRSGAREFLTQPLVLEELMNAMQRVKAPQIGASGTPVHQSRSESKVIAVAGSRGGIGSTCIAVNLGCALAQDPRNNVVLLDLDLALGDTDVALDILPSYTLGDVAANIDRLDMTFLRGSLSKHATGLSLLPHPVQLEDSALIHEEHLQRVIGLLKATYSHVILDLSKSFRPTDFAGLKAADVILLVAQLELTSLRNVVRLMMSMQALEGFADKVQVVLTRVGASEQEITIRKAEETIGRPIFWQVPNDSKNVLGARNAGSPLVQFAPRSKINESITALAEALSYTNGEALTEKPAKKKGFSFFSKS
jgi:pilus assembly protein CpaE